MDPQLLKYLRVPIFVFIVVLFGVTANKIIRALPKNAGAADIAGVAVVIAGLVIVGLATVFLYLLNERWKDDLKRQLAECRARCTELQAHVQSPPIDMITKGEYAALLKRWNDSGEGEVLLYNIELQSFADRASIKATWGGLKDLTHVKQICLLLPAQKIDRWEQAVLSHASGFFADETNRRFRVCEFEAARTVGEGPAPIGIAFAMYRYTAGSAPGSLHPTVVWFILSRPFAVLQEHYYDLQARWWDYKTILSVHDREDLRAKALAIWEPLYDPSRSRDVARVIEDTRPLEPIEPEVFFERIWLPDDKKAERLAQLGRSRVKVDEKPSPIPLDKDSGIFEINYDDNGTIAGHYEGVDIAGRHERPGVVWVGGFTELYYTEMWRLFEHSLKREEVVRVYYQASSAIGDVTLTRYQQDMREVLAYANRQNAIQRNRLVVIARSINGLVAALVAAEPEIREMLAGVILIAPVFDVIEMMDNYRAQRGQSHVRIEKAWRAAPGYTNGEEWEQPRRQRPDGTVQGGWLEFFGHDVGLQIVADICRHPEDTFRLEGFKQAIARITEHVPVYILSHREDPITGSARALEALDRAAEGSILIRRENYEHIPIGSKHLEPEQIEKGTYPFRHSELREVQVTLRKILARVGLPTVDT